MFYCTYYVFNIALLSLMGKMTTISVIKL